MPADAAEQALRPCCASTRWCRGMARRRPFRDVVDLHRAADEVWWSLDPKDWREAFAAHPRIGERGTGWSGQEQAGTRGASADTMTRLARGNLEYEKRFGHVFLICATGRNADEMLANLEQRMTNDPADELRVAAGEQARITHLRLDRFLATVGA